MFIISDDLAKLLEHHGITAELFAEVYLEIRSVDDAVKLQAALDLIGSWASDWQSSASVIKCNVIIFMRGVILTNKCCTVADDGAGCALETP